MIVTTHKYYRAVNEHYLEGYTSVDYKHSYEEILNACNEITPLAKIDNISIDKVIDVDKAVGTLATFHFVVKFKDF